jgi:hypothetical protein
MRLWIPALLLVTLTQCVGAPTPPPPPPPARPVAQAPVATPAPAAPQAANWEDWPITPGDWTYARDARGSVARFGRAGADADLVIRCASEGRRIFVSRPGRFADGESGRIALRASTALQSYPLQNSSESPPYVAAEIPAMDRHLDALAFSRGRFLVQVKGVADLVVPAWPELARVVEDCRG